MQLILVMLALGLPLFLAFRPLFVVSAQHRERMRFYTQYAIGLGVVAIAMYFRKKGVTSDSRMKKNVVLPEW